MIHNFCRSALYFSAAKANRKILVLATNKYPEQTKMVTTAKIGSVHFIFRPLFWI